jgi:hypothetical protein
MTDHTTGAAPSVSGSDRQPRGKSWNPTESSRVGWLLFASIMMAMVGYFHLAQGLVALFDDEYFLVADSRLPVALDYAVWGWTHLVLGGLVMVAGLTLFSGSTWARVVAIAFAALSAVVNFCFIAAQPFWSATVIVLDVFVILALTVHGND